MIFEPLSNDTEASVAVSDWTSLTALMNPVDGSCSADPVNLKAENA